MFAGSDRLSCRYSRAVVVAAFVLSCLAVVISLGSLWFNKRDDARAASRHYLDRTPKLVGGVEEIRQFDKAEIWIELQSPEGVDSIEIALPDGDMFEFEADMPGSRGGRAQWDQPVANGQRARWRVEVIDTSAGGGVRAQVTCHRIKEHWTVPVDLEKPFGIVRYISQREFE